MNKWSPERAEANRQFIDEYFMENRKSPTVRDIAAGRMIIKNQKSDEEINGLLKQ